MKHARIAFLLLALTTPALAQQAPPPPPAPAAPASAAQTPEDRRLEEAGRRATRISDELKSPFCPGKTLNTCTSGQAFVVRQEIRDRILKGEPEESIIQDLQMRFGEDIRNPPQPWYSVLGPILPVVLGVLLVGVVFWRWRRGAAQATPRPAPATGPGGDADRLARLRAQVASHDDE